MDTQCRVELLGGLRVLQGERVITRFRTQKAASLLAYLAYHFPQAHPRETLIELLWPEVEPDTGRNRLRMALTFLRHPLEPPGVPAGAVLQADRTSVRLNPLGVSTDVAEFQAELKQAASAASNEARAAHLTRAVELYRGELLPGCYENWVQTEQQRLTERFLQAIRQLVAYCMKADDLNGALNYALRAVSIDPLREESHRDVMRLYAAVDRPADALRQYQELERLLEEELGVSPAPDTRELAETLRRETRPVPSSVGNRSKRPLPKPDSPPPVSPLQTPDSEPPTLHLPLQFTRFFGRDSEIAQLVTLLQGQDGERGREGEGEKKAHVPVLSLPMSTSQDSMGGSDNVAPVSLSPPLPLSPSASSPRLVTLTGPGGSGKTRLAIEVAGRLAQVFPGGIWFVSLADLVAPRLIPGTIVNALRLPRSPKIEPLDQIIEFLNGCNAPVLLVLDNLEHLLAQERRESEDGAPLLRALLEGIPTLTLLVTSRQMLSLEGEREFPVAPLPVPQDDIQTFGPEHLMQFAGVQLFVDRTQTIKSDFQITKNNAAAVTRLCDRLEGLPLAIELAAARANVLTPSRMLSQLEHRFDFLVSRRRDAIDRHRTLQAAIEWSYRLLSPELQRFFARLSVFRGGWTMEAAEAVCEEPLALDYMARLLECSLVLREERAGKMRFRMLETLREFGDLQLRIDAGTEHTRKKHCEWFLSLAENAEPQLTGPDQASWLERLELDHDNFRSALAWCGQREREAESGLRMAGALFRFWMVRGYFTEGRRQLTETLERMERETRTEFHAKALNGIGAFTAMQGDIEGAKSLFRKSLAIRKKLGDKIQIASSLNNLGVMEIDNDLYDYTAARELFEASLSIYKEVGDKRGSGYSVSRLGHIAHLQGDYEKARLLYAEGLALRRELGDAHGIALSLSALGHVARDLGSYSEARTLSEESLEIKRTLGDRWGIADSLNTLGVVARNTGDYVAARTLHEESLSIFKGMADKGCTANALTMLGRVAFCQGDYAEARKLYAEGLALRVQMGNKRHIAECLEVIAEMLFSEEQTMKAVQVWGAADKLREQSRSAVIPAESDQYTRLIARARSILDEASFDSAWKTGQAMPIESTIAYAL